MKMRVGFVSNSSSSSFVLALSPAVAEPCPHCKRKSHLLEAFSNNNGWEDTCITSEDLNHIIHYVEGMSDQYAGSNYGQKVLDAIGLLHGEGWQIMLVELSYHDYNARNLLDEEIENGNAKMIFCGD